MDPVPQYVIYSRKSKLTGKGESIENQIELCRQYIAAHAGVQQAENALIYEDEGFSGGTLERPQFKKMMKDSRTIPFAAIVVYRLDRISRNIGDFAKLIEDMGSRKIDFISIREQFDTSSPMGRAMMYIASVFSQLERETIAERIRDNMHELAKTGRWLGGITPTGYASQSITNVTIDGKRKKACMLNVIPEEIRLVKTIFQVFLDTGSLSKTDQYLMERKITTKHGKQFTRFSIRGILTNPVYMIADDAAYAYLIKHKADLFAQPQEFDGVHGIMAYNRTLQRPGKTNQIRPMEEWIVAVGGHQGVISGEQWVEAQHRLASNSAKGYRRPRSHVALLSGILRCASCGNYMRPKMTSRMTAAGEPVYTYLCNTKERSHSQRCAMKNINGNWLDTQVVAVIREMGEEREAFCKALQENKKLFREEKGDCDEELTKLKEQFREKEQEIQSLVTALSKASSTPVEGYIMDQIQAVHQIREGVKQRIEELEHKIACGHLTHQQLMALCKKMGNFGNFIDDCSIEEKRQLLRCIVQKILWDGENATLYVHANGNEFVESEFVHGVGPLGEDSK